MDDHSSLPTPAQRPRLPPEIDLIIDMLHDDERTLARCALVCRSWVSASRHHLFSVISIDSQNFPYICEILSSAICTITSAVEHLVIIKFPELRDLHKVVDRLSNVTQLSLHYSANFTGIGPFHLPTLIPFFLNLESLHLQSMDAAFVYPLLSLLQNSPRFRCLSVRFMYACNYGSEEVFQGLELLPIEQGGFMLELESLHLQFCEPALLDWLMTRWGSRIPRLTVLDMRMWSPVGVDKSIKRLLETIGPSLEIVRLCCASLLFTRIAPHFVPVTQLRSFYFEPFPQNDNYIHYLGQALRYLPSLHLQELTVAYMHHPLDSWSELSSLLEDSQNYPALRSLTFINLRYYSTWEPWITEKFPLCAARGILHFRAKVEQG